MCVWSGLEEFALIEADILVSRTSEIMLSLPPQAKSSEALVTGRHLGPPPWCTASRANNWIGSLTTVHRAVNSWARLLPTTLVRFGFAFVSCALVCRASRSTSRIHRRMLALFYGCIGYVKVQWTNEHGEESSPRHLPKHIFHPWTFTASFGRDDSA